MKCWAWRFASISPGEAHSFPVRLCSDPKHKTLKQALRKFRSLLLGTVCSLLMTLKSCTIFLGHLLHIQGQLCPCRSDRLDGREGLGTCELTKQQPHLDGQPPTPLRNPPLPTAAVKMKPWLEGEGSRLAYGSQVSPHNPRPLQ